MFPRDAADDRSFCDFVQVLRCRASRQPERVAYRFLVDGETEEIGRTYAELDAQARTIAARLQQSRLAGRRALLLYPRGLEFVSAFFGCLYAGVVAVPTYLPRRNRPATRLEGIAADAQASIALTSGDLIEELSVRFQHHPRQHPQLRGIAWLDTDDLDPGLAEQWQDPEVGPDAVACLQYTSGSTSEPEGVVLTHAHLLGNSQLIYETFEHESASTGVSWLPPYHDMGLIGGILQAPYAGRSVVLMSPVHVVQRPIRWLEAISRYRAATSGGPNFIYDLCARSIPPEQCASLDLSCWEVAFNGGEPTCARTLERFAKAFEACGFRPEALLPCYGLAEATLLVSGGPKGARPVTRALGKRTLEGRHAASAFPSPDDLRERPMEIVGCGRPAAGLQLAIVDPESLTACEPGQIGEIWVSGPTVARGYWNRPEETAATFQASLEGAGAGNYLRTGDLGTLSQGQLFVTGRLKDLIIIDGRNHYPQDIERSVEEAHPALRVHSGAAFAVDHRGERLAVAHEIEHNGRNVDLTEVFDSIRQAIAEQHGIAVHAIALLKVGAVPTTSSGKVQRRACRERFLSGELRLVAEWFSDELAALRRPPPEEATVEPDDRSGRRPDDRAAAPVARGGPTPPPGGKTADSTTRRQDGRRHRGVADPPNRRAASLRSR